MKKCRLAIVLAVALMVSLIGTRSSKAEDRVTAAGVDGGIWIDMDEHATGAPTYFQAKPGAIYLHKWGIVPSEISISLTIIDCNLNNTSKLMRLPDEQSKTIPIKFIEGDSVKLSESIHPYFEEDLDKWKSSDFYQYLYSASRIWPKGTYMVEAAGYGVSNKLTLTDNPDPTQTVIPTQAPTQTPTITYPPATAQPTVVPAITNPPTQTPYPTQSPTQVPVNTTTPPTQSPAVVPTPQVSKLSVKTSYNKAKNKVTLSFLAKHDSYRVYKDNLKGKPIKEASAEAGKKTKINISNLAVKKTYTLYIVGYDGFFDSNAIKEDATVKVKTNITPSVSKVKSKKIKTRQFRVKWKQTKGAKAMVYGKVSGKWKEVFRTGSGQCVLSLSSITTLPVRVRSYIKYKGKMYYSKYSKTIMLKV